jgi:hypothetical protein
LFPEDTDRVGDAFLLFGCQRVPPGFELIGEEHLDHKSNIALEEYCVNAGRWGTGSLWWGTRAPAFALALALVQISLGGLAMSRLGPRHMWRLSADPTRVKLTGMAHQPVTVGIVMYLTLFVLGGLVPMDHMAHLVGQERLRQAAPRRPPGALMLELRSARDLGLGAPPQCFRPRCRDSLRRSRAQRHRSPQSPGPRPRRRQFRDLVNAARVPTGCSME